MKTNLQDVKKSIRKDNPITTYQKVIDFEAELRTILTDPLAERGLCNQTKDFIRDMLGEMKE